MSGIEEFYIHTATVTPFAGKNGYGKDTYGEPAQVGGFWDGGARLIRNRDGEQVVSSGTFFTAVTNQAAVPIDSLLTVLNVSGRIVAVELHDSGPLGLPDHLAVSVI